MIHVTDDGCRLAYEVEGPDDAAPLVLSNSLGTAIHLWDRQFPAWSQAFRVLRYDTRGHGASDAPRGQYSLERLGQDLLSLMDAAGMKSAHICGISIGGMTGLWAAVHAADRVESLVLANTAAQIGSADLWNERIRIAREEGLAALADAAMARWFTPSFRAREPETVVRFHSTLTRTNIGGYTGCCAALRGADLRQVAHRVRARTLVVTGAHDTATPPEAGVWLRDRITGAALVELDTAHLSNVEAADDFTGAVASFLA